MKNYILIQMQIDSKEIEGNNANISMSNIVRQVSAENKESAIGKFVIATKNIKAHKKLDIECYDLSELLSL